MTDRLRQVLVQLIRDNVPRQVTVCEVLSVDEATLTCKVKELESDQELFQVRLNAASTEFNTVLIPKVGSVVLVSLIGNNRQARYVTMVSECSKIYLMGDENGALPVSIKIVERLNLVENKVNDLLSAITGWVPVPNDGGAALLTVLTDWLQKKLVETTVENIHNDKIYH
jgi:hypothetical protein